MEDRSPVETWGAITPTYVQSPAVPPDTTAEYLVSWRRVGWQHRAAHRRVFHTYDKATEFRAYLERYEREAESSPHDQILVTIHTRKVGPWREIA